MRYYIRADGNSRIGMGHLMRTMTIAHELTARLGTEDSLTYICADEDSAALIRAHGYQVQVTETDYTDMPSELARLDGIIGDRSAHNAVILVDSYQVTDEYLTALRSYGTVYYMDDMQEHKYPVDAVINYNPYASKERYLELYGGSGTACYIGNRFIPVRPEFLGRGYKVSDSVKNVLITTGGGDIDGIAGQIVAELKKIIDDSSVTYHIVAGQYNPHIEELRRQALQLGGIEIHEHVEDMAGLMLSCDLAVTAGGSTTYELCAIGVPFIVFTYAANQEQIAEYMDDHGIADDAGAYHRVDRLTIENIGRIYRQYLEYPDIRRAHSDMGREIVDGRGADRLARLILGLER